MYMKINKNVLGEIINVLSRLNILEVGHLLKITISKEGEKIVSIVGVEPITEEKKTEELKDVN